MKVNTYPEQGEWREVDTEGCWACNAAHRFVNFDAFPNMGVILQNDAGDHRYVQRLGFLGDMPAYQCLPVSQAVADAMIEIDSTNAN